MTATQAPERTGPPVSPSHPEEDGGGPWLFIVATTFLIIPLMAIAIFVLAAPAHHQRPTPITTEYVVPLGTWDKVNIGEHVQIMPPQVQFHVGDTLVIRNDDSRTTVVGPYTVGPGQTLREVFDRPETLSGVCSLSPDGQVRIVVV